MSDEMWRALPPCDESFYTDLVAVLDAGAIQHRRRAATKDDVLSTYVGMGMKTRFGAHAGHDVVIEVPAAAFDRAKSMVDHHFAELERSARLAAGVAPATDDQRRMRGGSRSARRAPSRGDVGRGG